MKKAQIKQVFEIRYNERINKILYKPSLVLLSCKHSRGKRKNICKDSLFGKEGQNRERSSTTRCLPHTPNTFRKTDKNNSNIQNGNHL